MKIPKLHLETLYGYLNHLFVKVTEADLEGLAFNGEGHRVEPSSGGRSDRCKALARCSLRAVSSSRSHGGAAEAAGGRCLWHLRVRAAGGVPEGL